MIFMGDFLPSMPTFTSLFSLRIATMVAALVVSSSTSALATAAISAPLLDRSVAVADDRMALNRRDLSDLSIEELMDVKVISFSRHEVENKNIPASVTVLTEDDIRRSGATSVPEALRLVPGLEVASINANMYAITARGLNDTFSDKILVLVDGRSVYSPTFSGVWWQAINYPMEDLAKIEVVRGPGVVMWGSNAFNCVINVISKSATKTRGALFSAFVGNEEKGTATVRGGWGDDAASYRLYAMGGRKDAGKYRLTPHTPFPGRDGDPYYGEATQVRGGGRADFTFDEGRQLTLSADAYRVTAGAEGNAFVARGFPNARYVNDDLFSGANVSGKYTVENEDGFGYQASAYFDQSKVATHYVDETIDTVDATLLATFPRAGAHVVSVGGGYRNWRHTYAPGFEIELPDVTRHLFNVFAQDEILLADDRFRILAGVKAEKNDYTGWEVEPNLRAIWQEGPISLWGSVARAVRLPNLVERSVYSEHFWVGADPAYLYILKGDEDVTSMEMLSAEVGVKAQVSSSVYLDLTVYHNDYRRIIGNNFDENGITVGTDPVPHYQLPLVQTNVLDGRIYGGEVTLEIKPAPWARLSLAYAHTRVILTPMPEFDTANNRATAASLERISPGHVGKLKAQIDLPRQMAWDTMLYYTSASPTLFTDIYWKLDMRLAWRPADDMEISLVGRNLLEPVHEEFGTSFLVDSSGVERDFLLKFVYEP